MTHKHLILLDKQGLTSKKRDPPLSPTALSNFSKWKQPAPLDNDCKITIEVRAMKELLQKELNRDIDSKHPQQSLIKLVLKR